MILGEDIEFLKFKLVRINPKSVLQKIYKALGLSCAKLRPASTSYWLIGLSWTSHEKVINKSLNKS